MCCLLVCLNEAAHLFYGHVLNEVYKYTPSLSLRLNQAIACWNTTYRVIGQSNIWRGELLPYQIIHDELRLVNYLSPCSGSCCQVYDRVLKLVQVNTWVMVKWTGRCFVTYKLNTNSCSSYLCQQSAIGCKII